MKRAGGYCDLLEGMLSMCQGAPKGVWISMSLTTSYDSWLMIHHGFIMDFCWLVLCCSMYIYLFSWFIYHFRIFLAWNNEQFCERCFWGGCKKQTKYLHKGEASRTRLEKSMPPSIVFWRCSWLLQWLNFIWGVFKLWITPAWIHSDNQSLQQFWPGISEGFCFFLDYESVLSSA